VEDQGPVVLGNIQFALSADGHQLEMIVPYKGFLVDADGNSIVTLGKTLDLSFSLEASGELSNEVSPGNPNGLWGSDTGDPINGYYLNAVGAAVQVQNTIIAGNSATTDRNVSGAFVSLGNNLLGSVGSATGFGAPGDQLGVNVLTVLDTNLADNGGPTLTHALLADSPAIDAGDNGPLTSTVDQRGLPRIVDGDGNGSNFVDIGAVEFQTSESLDAIFANTDDLDAVLS
jgi:hypothetical protein